MKVIYLPLKKKKKKILRAHTLALKKEKIWEYFFFFKEHSHHINMGKIT